MAFKEDGGHTDILTEIRHAIVFQMQRQNKYFAAGRAMEMGPQIGAPTNATAASVEQEFAGEFSTGYNSGTGLTTVPFTWGISVWGSGDVWTGS